MVFWFGKSNESDEPTTPSSSKTQYRRKIRATPPPPVVVPPSSPPPDDEEKRTSHHGRPPHWKSTLNEDQQARDVVERLKQDGVNAANSKRKDKKMELINKKRNESKTTAMSINTGNETAEIPSIRAHEKGLFSVAPPFPEHKRAATDSEQVGQPSGKKSRKMDDEDEDDIEDNRRGGVMGWLGANGVALSLAVAISAIILANLVRKK